METAELSKLSRATPRTIRYYTELGLLNLESYNKGCHAVYSSKSLITLQRIQALKEAGVSLKEIKIIFDAIRDNETSEKKLTGFLIEKLAHQRLRIAEKESQLTATRKELDRILEEAKACRKCPGKGSEHDCEGCGKLSTFKTFGIKEEPANE